MIKKIFCAMLCFATLQVFAKPKSIGIQGGMNYSNLYAPYIASPGLSSNFAFTFQKYKNKYVFFETGLALDKNAFINKLLNSNNSTTINTEITSTSTYLSMPLIIGFKTGGKLFGYTKLGATPSVLLSWDKEININNPTVTLANTSYSPTLKISPTAEVGIGKMFGSRVAITIGTKVNYQLFSVYDKKAIVTEGIYYYKSLSANIGFHFFIKRME